MTVLGWGKDPYGAVGGWFGSGASLSLPDVDGIVTVTGLGNMSPLSVGRALTITGASPENNGTYPIVAYVSASSVKILHANCTSDAGVDWLERLSLTPSYYGAGAKGSGTSIVSALAISTHTVRVGLSAEPMHSSNFVPGDALNPSTWNVQNLSTLAFLHVVSVEPHSPTSYDLLTLEAFGDVTVLHEASSTTLLAADGVQTLNAPRAADFYGIIDADEATQAARLAKQRVTSRDLKNSQVPASVPGTLTIEQSGDYATVSGADLLKKLILRRLMTRPGDFFHLPKYGIGLREKEPIPAGNLGKLKKEIERQILLEPEVASAIVGLTLDSSGVLTVRVQASLRPTGEVVAFSTPIGPQGGVLL